MPERFGGEFLTMRRYTNLSTFTFTFACDCQRIVLVFGMTAFVKHGTEKGQWGTTLGQSKARFPFKRNRLRCVCCVNENRKKRKRLASTQRPGVSGHERYYLYGAIALDSLLLE